VVVGGGAGRVVGDAGRRFVERGGTVVAGRRVVVAEVGPGVVEVDVVVSSGGGASVVVVVDDVVVAEMARTRPTTEWWGMPAMATPMSAQTASRAARDAARRTGARYRPGDWASGTLEFQHRASIFRRFSLRAPGAAGAS
jgi:hypothetical protein